MQVFTNQVIFSSRNSHIRLADNIARRVNQVYPRLSSTKYEGLKNSDKFNENIVYLLVNIKKMRKEMYSYLAEVRGDYLKKSQRFAELITNKKLGNCHESAILAEIAAKANGIRNCYTAQLKPLTDKPSDAHDHVVLYVDSLKHPYVIDPWLGFADFVPNALERYRKEFSNHFDFDKFGTEKMFFEPLGMKRNLSKAETSKFKEKFSQLIITTKDEAIG